MVNHLYMAGMLATAAVCSVGDEAHAAGVFYGVTSSGRLVQFDMAAQTASTVANVMIGAGQASGLEDCDFDGAGNLYAVRSFSAGGFPPVTLNQSLRVSTVNGSALLQAGLGDSGQPYTSMAFGGAGTNFTSVNNLFGQLGTLNAASGAFASISGSAHGSPFRVEAVAYNPIGGSLFGIVDMGSPFTGSSYSLISFNTTTGVSSLVGSLGISGGSFKSLRFDDVGVAYTVNGSNGNVYTLNTSTGAASFLFAGGSAAMDTTGLAYIPTPGAAAAMVILAGGAVRRRRR